MTTTARAHWSSRVAFILAAAGSAIGLGNIWKFPYITGENGGGAFVLVYLACIAMVGLPIFIGELYVGQQGQRNAVQSFEVTHREGSPWRVVGWAGVLAAFLILSFYSVVGGWIFDFVFRSVANQFSGQTDEAVKGVLGELFASPVRQLVWHTVFLGLVAAIVIKGLNDGIERWNKILMPALLVLLGVLLVRSFFLEGFGQAVTFLFAPDFSELNAVGILEAVGHSFFTLSVGMGAMITYGSYLKTQGELVKTAVTIALMDTAIALIAGVIIFSVVFSFGFDAESGPGLMFQTLPMLFAKLPGGYFIGVAFFVLVAFAALTSAVSLLEVAVAFWVEKHEVSRVKTTLGVAGVIWALGILSALSFNVLSEVKLLGHTFFDGVDALTSRVILPIGGGLIALFFGWVLGPKAAEHVTGGNRLAALGLMWSARVLAPLGILAMLVYGLL